MTFNVPLLATECYCIDMYCSLFYQLSIMGLLENIVSPKSIGLSELSLIIRIISCLGIGPPFSDSAISFDSDHCNSCMAWRHGFRIGTRLDAMIDEPWMMCSSQVVSICLWWFKRTWQREFNHVTGNSLGFPKYLGGSGKLSLKPMGLRNAADFNARCSYNLEVILMILHHPIARVYPMRLKQVHKPSPSRHHSYRWYKLNHQKWGGLWHCFTHNKLEYLLLPPRKTFDKPHSNGPKVKLSRPTILDKLSKSQEQPSHPSKKTS